MRRQLNWSLALFVLSALLAPLHPGTDHGVLTPVIQPAAGDTARAAGDTGAPSPFAYIREDGSLLYVPAMVEGPPATQVSEHLHAHSGFDQWTAVEPAPASVANLETAVFTWSSPVGADRPIYQ